MSLIARHPTATLVAAMAVNGTIGAVVTEAGTDPVTTVFWRAVFGTAFLLPWCLAGGLLAPSRLTARGLGLGLAAGVSMVLSWVAYLAGFGLTDIATTTILYHVQPFFVILLAALLLGERVTPNELAWMSCAFIGVALASGLAVPTAAVSSEWVLGVGVALVGALLYAIPTLLAKRLVGQPPEVTALCQTIAGVVMLVPFAGLVSAVPSGAWGWLVVLGVFHTGLSYVLIYGAIPHLPTPLVAVIGFLYPAVVILVDWLVYEHPIGWPKAIGMGLIALATLGVRLGWRVPIPARA